MSTTFTLKGNGFNPGEKVGLWTTDPSSKARDASYIQADAIGNILIKVQTSDPNGLAAAAGGNYTTFVTEYDVNGILVDQYLLVILYTPSAGNWYLTGQGAASGATQIFNFNIIQ
jgi:hypothetical protein